MLPNTDCFLDPHLSYRSRRPWGFLGHSRVLSLWPWAPCHTSSRPLKVPPPAAPHPSPSPWRYPPSSCFFGNPARALMPEVPCFTYTLALKSQFCVDPCVNTGLGVLCLIFTVLGDMSHLQLTEEKTGKRSSCLRLHQRLKLDRPAAELSFFTSVPCPHVSKGTATSLLGIHERVQNLLAVFPERGKRLMCQIKATLREKNTTYGQINNGESSLWYPSL